MALTGFPITGVDAKEFGIADELVHYSSAYEEEISDILFAMEFPIPNYDLISGKGHINPRLERIRERQESNHNQNLADIFERARKKHDNIIHEEFFEPKDNIPSLTADSDYKYKEMMKAFNKRYTEGQEPGYLDGSDAMYMNYYNYVLGYVKSHSGHPYSKNPHTLLLKNVDAINRCFIPNTLEEITDNLRREAS